MKIRFLAYNAFGIGGTVRTTINTANRLAELGCDVEIMSVKRTSASPLLGVRPGVKMYALFDARGEHTYAGRSLAEALLLRGALRVRSRLIHRDEDLYRNFSAYTDLRLIQYLRGLRDGILITTIPSFNALAARWVDRSVIRIGQEHKVVEEHSPAIRKMITREYSSLDGLTCVTQEAAAYYQRLFAGSRLRIEFIPNGTPTVDARPNEEHRVILSAGRLVPDKGFDELIRAFALVARTHPTWTLRIFGNGNERENLLQLIVSLGLHNNVFIYPQTSNLAAEIGRSDIFALASKSESFGMVLVEAMSQGVPCVSSESQGPRQLIADGENGALIPQGDTQAFSKALLHLVESREQRTLMGTRAQASVEKYSMTSVGKAWLEFLQSLDDAREAAQGGVDEQVSSQRFLATTKKRTSELTHAMLANLSRSSEASGPIMNASHTDGASNERTA